MVNPGKSRGPYSLPPAGRDVDSLTYNPQADARPDNAPFDENSSPSIHPVGARGADNQPTYRDAGKEDLETERSEMTGEIPKSEVNDLLESGPSDGKNVGGRTRGKKVDAYKQERDVDQFLDETGISTADKDVEIGAATGR